MDKKVFFHTIIGIIVLYLILLLTYSIFIWYDVQNYYQLITRSLTSPIYFLIFLAAGIFVGIKNLQNGKNKNILYKVPLTSVIALLIVTIPFLLLGILAPCEGEGCLGKALILISITTPQGLLITLTSLIIFALYSFFIALILYFLYDSQKLKRLILVIFVLLIVINSIVIIADSGCPPKGTECIGKRAAKLNDISICEKASVPQNCITQMATASGDESICEELLNNQIILNYYEKMDGELEFISNLDYNECILFVSTKKSDKSICEKSRPLLGVVVKDTDSKSYAIEECSRRYEEIMRMRNYN